MWKIHLIHEHLYIRPFYDVNIPYLYPLFYWNDSFFWKNLSIILKNQPLTFIQFMDKEPLGRIMDIKINNNRMLFSTDVNEITLNYNIKLSLLIWTEKKYNLIFSYIVNTEICKLPYNQNIFWSKSLNTLQEDNFFFSGKKYLVKNINIFGKNPSAPYIITFTTGGHTNSWLKPYHNMLSTYLNTDLWNMWEGKYNSAFYNYLGFFEKKDFYLIYSSFFETLALGYTADEIFYNFWRQVHKMDNYNYLGELLKNFILNSNNVFLHEELSTRYYTNFSFDYSPLFFSLNNILDKNGWLESIQNLKIFSTLKEPWTNMTLGDLLLFVSMDDIMPLVNKPVLKINLPLELESEKHLYSLIWSKSFENDKLISRELAERFDSLIRYKIYGETFKPIKINLKDVYDK